MDPNPYTKAFNDWLISQLPVVFATLTGILAVFLPWIGYQAQRWFKIAGDAALLGKQKMAAKTAVLAAEQKHRDPANFTVTTNQDAKKEATAGLKALAPHVTDKAAPVLVEAAVREMKVECGETGAGTGEGG